MRTLNMTQKNLAERMGCSQQYVSLLLKGSENLTLETVAKLEKVLDFKLLSFANAPDAGTGYLSESGRPVYGGTNPPSPSGELTGKLITCTSENLLLYLPCEI